MQKKDILNDPNIPVIPWEEIVVGEKLGVGAAAIVRRGIWKSNKQDMEVALKQLLLPAQQLTPSILKDFLLEIKLTSEMYHENVVKLIGVCCSPELDLYLVTELLHRGSIRDVLNTKGKNLNWDIRLKLLCDAAKGMAYLHSRNVIHRDLKPGNLLVSKNWQCKVADFGASTIKVQVEKTMTVIGTPSYMAPEVLMNVNYTEKADVYSFGVILVEMYTGDVPYTGADFQSIKNQVQLISRIVTEHLHPDTSMLPPALAQLVYDCWNQTPSLRPSFSEIIIRLRRLQTLKLTLPMSGSSSSLEGESEIELNTTEISPSDINYSDRESDLTKEAEIIQLDPKPRKSKRHRTASVGLFSRLTNATSSKQARKSAAAQNYTHSFEYSPLINSSSDSFSYII